MKIGILGSGLMGGKLGTIFARAGHDVVFSYARSERKLKRLAKEAVTNAPLLRFKYTARRFKRQKRRAATPSLKTWTSGLKSWTA
jgi:predicted dinucleotide-binding enzyme